MILEKILTVDLPEKTQGEGEERLVFFRSGHVDAWTGLGTTNAVGNPGDSGAIVGPEIFEAATRYRNQLKTKGAQYIPTLARIINYVPLETLHKY